MDSSLPANVGEFGVSDRLDENVFAVAAYFARYQASFNAVKCISITLTSRAKYQGSLWLSTKSSFNSTPTNNVYDDRLVKWA